MRSISLSAIFFLKLVGGLICKLFAYIYYNVQSFAWAY